MEAMTVLVVVADPVTVALFPTALGLEEGGVPALPLEANMVVTTLGPSHHQAWVQHVTFPFLLLGTPVDMGAPTVDAPPIQGDGGVNGDRVGFQGPGLGALTLDLPTLGIPGAALPVFAIQALATVPIGVSSCIHPLKAEIEGRPGSGSPQLLALFLVSEAHAVVAVGLATLAGGAIHLVKVGGAVGRLAGTELGKVTLSHLLAARGSRSHQLTLVTAGTMGTLGPFLQSAVRGIAARVFTFLFLPTVTFFPIFQVPIATPPASIQRPGVWHVREAHPTSRLQIPVQFPPVAPTEHSGERVPSGSCHDAPAIGCTGRTAMCRIMAHAKVVANLMGHSGSHANGILRVVHADTSRLVHRAHSHERGQANRGPLKGPARD